ncbi:hypothetical protein NLN94_23930, partial [Citrobacter portucalensis]|uniref:hypothetical protein n=1 Tax=Citrobacter portucalensis TaxID=1639133 RepID=UPI00226BA301
AKLQDCQFIEIKIDGNTIAGASEEEAYKGWMEGYAPAGISTTAGPDSTYFDAVHCSVLVTKETSKLFEKYLMRGYKNIAITIVHRGSSNINSNYEVQRTVYDSCNFQNMSYELRDNLFLHFSFDFESTVAITFNVPNNKNDDLDKIGPIKYSLPAKKIV